MEKLPNIQTGYDQKQKSIKYYTWMEATVKKTPKNPDHEKLCGRRGYVEHNEYKSSRWSPVGHAATVTDTVSCCFVYIL